MKLEKIPFKYIYYTLYNKKKNTKQKQQQKRQDASRKSYLIATKIVGYQEQALKKKRLKFPNN